MKLYDEIGASNPAYLLADPQGADKIAIQCEPGNGVVKRGTVMYRKASGQYAPAASANVAATNMLAVLDETVDTSANTSIAEDAAAYRAGRFVFGKVTLASDAALSAANQVVLRGQGIVFDQMALDLLSVTYKANGGTGSDVSDNANYAAAYTVRNNPFTAPTGKKFSKWNTAAAGTGTDYTAAASINPTESLTLYAVWIDS